MLSNKEIRALSREQLKGHWLKFVLINLVMIIVAVGGSYLANFKGMREITLVELLAQVFISLGMFRLLLDIAKGRGFNFSNFRQPGRVYLRYLLVVILLVLLVGAVNFVLMAILFSVVLSMAMGGSVSILSGISSESIFPLLGSIGAGLVVLLLVIYVIILAINLYIGFTYSMVDLIVLANHDDNGAIDSLGASRKLMKGYKWRFFKLNLSFIGWAILCIFTLGIGFLWLSTYINMSTVNFYQELLKEREELAKDLNLVEPEESTYTSYTGDYQTQESESVEVKAIEEVKVEEPVKTEDPTQDSE